MGGQCVEPRQLTHHAAAGERFIACCDGGPISMLQAAYILRDWNGAKSVIAAPVSGDAPRPCNRKAKTVLGFTPGPIDEALLATAGSLVRLGLVPPP